MKRVRIKIWGALLAILTLAASCSDDGVSELYFVGDSLVAGWDVKSSFPTYITHNDGVNGAKIEDILTWNLDYRNKDVVMLVGTNNLGHEFVDDQTRSQFIADFVTEYRHTIEALAPHRVFVISILPKNLGDNDISHMSQSIQELNVALSQMVASLEYGVFVDVFDNFLYKGGLNMNYSLDGLHLNNLGYNILNVRLSNVL